MCSADAIGEFLQPRAQDLVIVASQRIARHIGAVTVGQLVGSRTRIARPVRQPHADHAECSGHQFCRPGTHHAVPGHVVHTAVITGGQPVRKPLFSFGWQTGPAYATGSKSEFGRPFFNLAR